MYIHIIQRVRQVPYIVACVHLHIVRHLVADSQDWEQASPSHEHVFIQSFTFNKAPIYRHTGAVPGQVDDEFLKNRVFIFSSINTATVNEIKN